MINQSILIAAAWAALASGVFAAFAEWLHHRRMQRLGRLAFGPDARACAWTAAAPVLRVVAFAGVVWSLVVLLGFDGSSRMRERNAAATRHLMVLLDVSPSMDLQDAGEGGKQTRRDRAAALLKSVMERANSDEIKITMACFYSDAMLLVRECADREVIWNFADNLPLHIAYRPGKTSLLKSLNTTAGYVKDFPRKSVTLLVLTDGDAVPDTGLQSMPSAVSDVLFVGVGNVARGTFLDGHLSRQDGASLSQVARRLGGHYHDGNLKNVPGELLRHLTASDQRTDHFQISLRTLAIITLALCMALICLLPLLLEHFGSAWKPVAIPAAADREPAARPSEVPA